jgi:hypothetical protein
MTYRELELDARERALLLDRSTTILITRTKLRAQHGKFRGNPDGQS